MKVKILTFGSLTEVLEREFYAEAPDTSRLVALLTSKHAALDGRKFLIAINDTIVKENTMFKANDVVALMPPYSGG
ncbi:hypothetical protein GCM10007415_03060 [Parapedobacter pyrenivorans]|uniref:Molybdopterin synthase sulfur carrier subunit n=1 Tax=Parapedobacter pyrenivorans TaxID=1305674 RepID=A0A917M4I2_9SPHI|nr:MoaD/ThiS family protein [Parapedobacter pyrenivorans]GGG74907.1 hypothetical protein GCM10007415_03060 [Parapedobacter pyrenivorans]